MIKILLKSTVWGHRPLYQVSGSPLLGYIGFGVIDRGTNVLQVRPITLCPLNCVFCSVDAGPRSRFRWAEFIVEPDAIVETVEYTVPYKGHGLEALIDTIGDSFTYPYLEQLVSELKDINAIRSVAVETHGALLTVERIKRLEEAGLDRVNLSIDTFNPVKAGFLQGVPWYDPLRVKRMAEYIVENTSIDLHVTPVWIPGVNDADVLEIAKWAYRIGAGKRWPPVTIQKYNVHKYGRKVPGIRPLSWKEFWKRIRKWENMLGFRLSWSMEEWGMERRPRVPCPYRRGSKVFLEVKSRGVFKGEFIGYDSRSGYLVAVIGGRREAGEQVVAEIIGDKDCLLIGRVIGKA